MQPRHKKIQEGRVIFVFCMRTQRHRQVAAINLLFRGFWAWDLGLMTLAVRHHKNGNETRMQCPKPQIFHPTPRGLGFRVQGLGFQGLGFRV